MALLTDELISRDGVIRIYDVLFDYDVLLDNGTTLPLSRRYRKQVQERLGLRRAPTSG